MAVRLELLKKHLKESRYHELKEKSLTSAVGTLTLLGIYEYTVFQTFQWNPTNIILMSALLAVTIVRLIHAKMHKISVNLWLTSYTFISGFTALSWCLLLNHSILHHLDQPEVAGFTYIVYGGLIASAAYSLSISKVDFFTFQGLILSSIAISLYLQPRFADVRTGALLMLLTFFLFLLRQRKIWSAFWYKQKVATFELENILDAFPGGISIIEDGRYKNVNKYVCESLNIEAKDLIGKEVGFLSPPSESAMLIKQFISDPKSKKIQKELTFETKIGPREHLFIIDSIIQGNHKSEYIVISIDIHQQKLAQAEIEKQRITLEHNAKMAALGEMSSGLAHEINNPLAVISARTQHLMHVLKLPSPDLEKVRAGIENINKTTFRIAQIIKGLRTFARDVENDPFNQTNVKEIIADTLTFCEARFRAHDIEIDTSAVRADLAIECKATQISQVLLNALNNSHDAIEKQPKPKWIRLETKDEGTHVVLTITDSGPGIPKELRTKLMQPFFTTKEVGKGTGLGLSLSKGIIEMHRGSIQFNFDHPNTQLVIRLPKKQDESAAA